MKLHAIDQEAVRTEKQDKPQANSFICSWSHLWYIEIAQ